MMTVEDLGLALVVGTAGVVVLYCWALFVRWLICRCWWRE